MTIPQGVPLSLWLRCKRKRPRVRSGLPDMVEELIAPEEETRNVSLPRLLGSRPRNPSNYSPKVTSANGGFYLIKELIQDKMDTSQPLKHSAFNLILIISK